MWSIVNCGGERNVHMVARRKEGGKGEPCQGDLASKSTPIADRAGLKKGGQSGGGCKRSPLWS